MTEQYGLTKMDFLDIGGGFTFIKSGTGLNFDEVCLKIGNCIDELFPEPYIQVIGEPGTYIVESC